MARKHGAVTRLRLTGAGGAYLLIVFAILVAAMNYSNSMAFILCFLMLGVLISSAAMGRGYVGGVGLRNVRVHPAFAGRGVKLTLELSATGEGGRPALFASAAGAEGWGEATGPISLHHSGAMIVDVGIPARRRGAFHLTAVQWESRYPLGVFHCRRRVHLDTSYLVYPNPGGERPWPPPESRWYDWTEGSHMSGGDDFSGLRPWRSGESFRHVDWKAVARGRALNIKEFSGGGQVRTWFDWNQLSGVPDEMRLSQLARWVLDASHLGVEFGLRLPQKTVEAGSGTRHTRACLEALARYGEDA
ncbi:MAG: DUF58 domain-containing protein [Acidobacteriota bacterium]|jgi:uncharacterized protein (DUF58 family)|nr:DUF58 domain-containing protein [Acidobacteriota bacterium]